MTERFENEVSTKAAFAEASPGEAIVSSYAKFFNSYGATVRDYAQAYTSNRLAVLQRTLNAAQLATPGFAANAALLSKVLKQAQFVPAHPERYEVRAMGQVKYFVLHRPGDDPASCSFSNTVLTFMYPPALDGGKKTATQFVVGTDGELTQMVDLEDLARHVSGSGAHNNTNCVGVEIAGSIYEPITPAQFSMVAWLVAAMAKTYGFEINAQTVLRHSDLSPATRRDPGPFLALDKLLLAANAELQRISAVTGSLFHAPFDPATETSKEMMAVLDAANQSLAPGQKALQVSAASRIESVMRLDRMSNIDRLALFQTAQRHALRTVSWQSADVANRVFSERQMKVALDYHKRAQESAVTSAGVMFYDVNTGLWNDGGQV